MITGPLQITRFRKGRAYPFRLKIDQASLELSQSLIELFQANLGQPRSQLEEELQDLNLEEFKPKVVQGLAKLLTDRCSFAAPPSQDPAQLRDQVLTASASYWREGAQEDLELEEHKSIILKNLGITDLEAWNNTQGWLYGDMASNQILQSLEPITPQALLERYNLAQVQGLLLSALRLEILLTQPQANLPQAMQMLKFFGLMFDLKPQGSHLKLVIDGPASILEHARSYGLELANFFPAALLLGSAQISARLKIPHRPREFDFILDEDHDYQSFYSAQGVWNHQKMEDLAQRFNQKYQPSLQASLAPAPILLKGNRYLLPDLLVQETASQKSLMVQWIRWMSPSRKQWLLQVLPDLPPGFIFALKAKRSAQDPLLEQLGDKALIFSQELTAPSLKSALAAQGCLQPQPKA